MISQSGKKILEQFVSKAKTLLIQNVVSVLQQYYGIWEDGHRLSEHGLTHRDADTLHTARLLHERLEHIKNGLPDGSSRVEATAVAQLIAEQAFTILNRFCALRMSEERGLILESVGRKTESEGFVSYDMLTGQGAAASEYMRYKWYIFSVFDELSVELPSVFNRYSPYGLIFPDETTLDRLLGLLNAPELSSYYDEQTGATVNFWKEDETIGWIYQYYNSSEERRRMRDASGKPRNSREMAVRNQFFTPDYVVRFLTDNSLGRMWLEMTGGKSRITDLCTYLVHRDDEVLPQRDLKDPTELSVLDPTCGSMHFGLYVYEVLEYIYRDAWENHPTLLQKYRYTKTWDSFRQLIPELILEHNLYGCEIDPRALQIAALSLWLRAQRSYAAIGLSRENRPSIKRSHLVLAEPMPGNKKMLKCLLEELELPMQRLIQKIWEKMQYAGEAGLLIKMEQEIEAEIEDLRKRWGRINEQNSIDLFSQTQEADIEKAKRIARLMRREEKEAFFDRITERLQEALHTLSEHLSHDEGYENALFKEDATRGFAFIELCQRKYDVILMNPPFGEGSEKTSGYLDKNYPCWCRNLVCAFFDRMQELLTEDGKVGAIFDRTVLIKSSYEVFRKRNICGFISFCADTGWGVLDANVETSTLVLSKNGSEQKGVFFDILDINPVEKHNQLDRLVTDHSHHVANSRVYVNKSVDFANLPNTIIGYYFNDSILSIFKCKNLEEKGIVSKKGHDLSANIYPRLFYEVINTANFLHMYNGGPFNMFYFPYYDMVMWKEEIIRTDSLCNIRSLHLQLLGTVGFGKRGEILDAHVLKKGSIFTREGIGIPNLTKIQGETTLGYLNSILAQYAINLYCAQHKGNGYVNLLPMPDYESKQSEIVRIVSEIIDLKRWWFSLDETNLEYRGFIGQIAIGDSLEQTFDCLQEKLTYDYTRYQELVKENDALWMDLADIEEHSEFRQTLEAYKLRRPYEELLSIDGASHENVLNRKVLAQELVMELTGIAFGRWDIAFRLHPEQIPPFGDVFDALPFMPVVALDHAAEEYPVPIPADGILLGDGQHRFSIVSHVRAVMHMLWGARADNLEYELCRLIETEDLQSYFDSPQGFFDYHFKRYTKSRRKAPIYWPVSSEKGNFTFWTYYPKLSTNTLPQLVLMLEQQQIALQQEVQRMSLAGKKPEENRLRLQIAEIQNFEAELQRIIQLPYKPGHDDGIPVTASPLVNLFRHNGWRSACQENWDQLQEGEYDWSHLAYTLYPARIREKVKEDWCLALTHGLEELCENKPKPKRERRSKPEVIQGMLDMD